MTFEYDPEHLIEVLTEKLSLNHYLDLCNVLEVAPSYINNIRNRKTPVTASMLVRMHDETGLTIRQLRALLGDRRSRQRHQTER